MSKILIVGNVTKDVYLRLDNRLNKFETDQNDIKMARAHRLEQQLFCPKHTGQRLCERKTPHPTI